MFSHIHLSLECNKLYQTFTVFAPECYLTKLYCIS